MPITIIFFPGRMPPRMRPLNGTVYAQHIEFITHSQKRASNKDTQENRKDLSYQEAR